MAETKKYIPRTDGSTPQINWNLISFKRFYPGTRKLITEGTAGKENVYTPEFKDGYNRPAGTEVVTSSSVIGTDDPTIYRKIVYGNQTNDTIYSTNPAFVTTNPVLGDIYKQRIKADKNLGFDIKYIPLYYEQTGGKLNYLNYFK